MSDTYQATYDAVRSRIGNIDSSVVAQAAEQAFDISWLKAHAQEQLFAVSHEWQRPSVMFRPRVFIDGRKWCALYGDNLQDGVAGFGDSPDEAMRSFDEEWSRRLAPPAKEPTP